MIFDGIRQPNTLYIASVSRGKDSTAMLRAIQLMGWPLDGIVSVDVWFDDDTPAELPPMVAFKDEWDKKCLEAFGLPVKRVCATKRGTDDKLTFVQFFYMTSPKNERTRRNKYNGFPMRSGNWCNTMLKVAPINKRRNEARNKNIVHYIGIANDEPLRIAKHIGKPNKVLPLVQIGWDEALCGLEAKYLGMLSPTYTTSMRDGCWFCHNQGISQLRNLRKNYPDLWAKLMAIDLDSPVTFHADGHTVHDFDRRFQCEDEGIIYADGRFKWSDIEQPQLRWF